MDVLEQSGLSNEADVSADPKAPDMAIEKAIAIAAPSR